MLASWAAIMFAANRADLVNVVVGWRGSQSCWLVDGWVATQFVLTDYMSQSNHACGAANHVGWVGNLIGCIANRVG